MSTPRIYNPAQLPGDELEQSFVARQEVLASLLRAIREQATHVPCQHTLLIGPRGMGKTTMGLMCLRRVEQDPALAARWQPVRFHEESYGIGDLADLWLTALRHLAHATGDNQWAKKANALVSSERDANRQAAYALAALLDFHQESGKRLLLFIENLDQVLAQIGDERQVHALRATLTQHPELMLLGSANTVFKAIRSHSYPFYEFFRLVFLHGLDADETRLLLKAAGQLAGNSSLDAMVAETGRLETMRRLTGGNPRLLKLACRMMVESPVGTAFDDLERLIDEQTPYFKGRIEQLPPQLRRVFHCLAEGWRPLLAKEVAAASKLSSSHASAQLRQLVEKGYAREQRLADSKRVYYEVVDRFYNIYYLLRLSHQGRGRFERLLQFLQALLEPEPEEPIDLAEAERYARRAWEYSPTNGLVRHVLSDVLARQGRWEESLAHLGQAVIWSEDETVWAGSGLAESFIRALAAGHATRVKEIMARTALPESMEPLWHATCAELGEEIGPLPAEVADAVAVVVAGVEAVRAGNTPAGRVDFSPGGEADG